jgi:L-fucose mutarotase/ribose pyranase (RbsD/FucU family)
MPKNRTAKPKELWAVKTMEFTFEEMLDNEKVDEKVNSEVQNLLEKTAEKIMSINTIVLQDEKKMMFAIVYILKKERQKWINTIS